VLQVLLFISWKESCFLYHVAIPEARGAIPM
jgi:hypothetical protein